MCRVEVGEARNTGSCGVVEGKEFREGGGVIRRRNDQLKKRRNFGEGGMEVRV